MSALMQDIDAFDVPARGIAIWFLGQNGWVIKSPGGTTIAVDPYLSDINAGRRPGIDSARRLPIFIDPENLKVDLFLCTHSHIDHACPVTIEGSHKAGTTRFAGPAETQAVFARAGVGEAEREVTFPNQVFAIGDITITGTYALPTDDTDLNHMGFVFQVDGGPRFYVTGDSAPVGLLRYARKFEPQLMAVCINGGFSNLSHWEAAELVREVDPELAFPCHYDMFADNTCPPHMFRASLTIQGVGEKYRLPEYETPFVYVMGEGGRGWSG
ncbi:MBL fold metallo-hydrolase [Microbaculum marinum]|uniref:MBL fold metallo-hydrolase n=1 Tax=Microbaculum marinum TaxID=1764581 RepID=A0AAW9RUP4_9HYPH